MAEITFLLVASLGIGALFLFAAIVWKTWWPVRLAFGAVGLAGLGLFLLTIDFLAHPLG